MSTSALEKLMFTIGVRDMATAPVVKLTRAVGGLGNTAQQSFSRITHGALGVAGAVYSIKNLLLPVREMQAALGEVKSLGVTDDALSQLEKTAVGFSTKYGESASDFVRSSYDIQSAISGLTSNELSAFTEASNILAKGTKADAATITSYMGTMYGIFKQNADAMGKADWVTQLTGQTGEAVKMFKTTGSEMSAAFSSLGASGQSSGVALAEQMAILGQLQATMSGAEAGTKYSAFLTGAAKAQEALGLQFTDSEGRLKPMIEMLSLLRQRYGDTFDELESLELKKAFGRKEGVDLIKLLLNDTAGLASNIDKLGKITGMKHVEQMAKDITDPWDQFAATTTALKLSFGNSLLPTILDVMGKLQEGLNVVVGWTQEFPNLTRWVGYGTLVLLSLAGALGIATIVGGLFGLVFSPVVLGLVAVATVIGGVIFLFKNFSEQTWTAIAALGVAFGAFAAVKSGIFLLGKATLVWNGILKAARTGLLLFNLLIYANPIGLMIGAVVALTAGIGWLVYKVGVARGWWQSFTQVLANISWMQPIYDFFGGISEWLDKLAGWFGIDIKAEEKLTATQELQSTLNGDIEIINDVPVVVDNQTMPVGLNSLPESYAPILPTVDDSWIQGNSDEWLKTMNAPQAPNLEWVSMDVEDLGRESLEHRVMQNNADLNLNLNRESTRGIEIGNVTVQANDPVEFMELLERQALLSGG